MKNKLNSNKKLGKKRKVSIMPNVPVYYLGAQVAKARIKGKGCFTVIKNGEVNLDKPFLLVCNHPSHMDYLFAVRAIYPARVNFVVSSYYFGKFFLSSGLKLLGAIPKLQFQPDVMAIKKMLSVVRSGGSVAIYPEGQVGGYGVTTYIHPAIAKLVKAMGVDVIVGKTCGTYLQSPKWAKYDRKGNVEFVLETIISQDQLQDLSEAHIYKIICEKMQHDDVSWAIENNYTYHGKKLAEGLEAVLYKCPKCMEEFAMEVSDNKISCSCCSNSAVMNSYGQLEQDGEHSKIFDRIYLWRNWQKECLKEQVAKGDFTLSTPVSLTMPREKGGAYAHVGDGVLSCDDEGIRYIGTLLEEDVELNFRWVNLPGLAFVYGDNFEVPSNKKIYAFAPQNGLEVEKWVELCEVMREREA